MPSVMNKSIDDYRAESRSFAASLEGAEPDWLPALRHEAMERFAAQGFPSAGQEEWKYNDLKSLAARSFQGPKGSAATVTEDELSPWRLRELDTHLLVFVDGLHAPALSSPGELPAGVHLGTLAELRREDPGLLHGQLGRIADSRQQPFTALNTGFLDDGLYLQLAAGTRLEKPVHLLWLSGAGERPTLSSPRVLLIAGKDSGATMIESFAGRGDGRHFSNAVTEIACGEGAEIRHFKLQRENTSSFHIGTSAVRQEAGSSYRSWEISLGGEMARRETHVRLEGEGASCELSALYLAHGEQRLDNRTRIVHAVPGCKTREIYKGILDDRSRGIFDGLILVERDAQRSDARQTNRNLLLSNDAIANSMPRLEIYTDDVKCTHGSTTGQLEDEQLFYLRSRGYSEDAARALLTLAFAREIIDSIDLVALRRQLSSELLRRLPQGELIKESP